MSPWCRKGWWCDWPSPNLCFLLCRLTYVSPLQRFYIRILWLVPIYGLESFFALFFRDTTIYIETMRDVYESWVLWSFYK